MASFSLSCGPTVTDLTGETEGKMKDEEEKKYFVVLLLVHKFYNVQENLMSQNDNYYGQQKQKITLGWDPEGGFLLFSTQPYY